MIVFFHENENHSRNFEKIVRNKIFSLNRTKSNNNKIENVEMIIFYLIINVKLMINWMKKKCITMFFFWFAFQIILQTRILRDFSMRHNFSKYFQSIDFVEYVIRYQYLISIFFFVINTINTMLNRNIILNFN